MDRFYESSFANDPGSRSRPGEGIEDEDDIQKQDAVAEWGLNIINRFIQVKDKQILDLRCQTGALSAHLQGGGANVFCVEPFEKNRWFAKERRGLSEIFPLPFSRFSQLPIPFEGPFDAVNVLTHHVLAHVLSPRMLLEKIFSILTPGGYLFLDEKDVLRPARYKTGSVFQSGPVHQYHLTAQTTARYLEATGFVVIECTIDRGRTSDFHHILAVARKPEAQKLSGVPPQTIQHGSSLERIRRRLWWLEQTWTLRQISFFGKRKTHKLLRRIRRRIAST
ncbi:class I SAM-dependent methyltransferase [Candidatus Nitrospira allomarina]|uniref:Class I SAM-dependent methyltransferase n=1 Tax=Candidatus Nitrospira allomarina TaxID=3020900 RepID=A0AA96GAK8_9BACT|nr:class I SAM-dependent methyltransferase [Candidatus Nitrospira allomarina]WNM58238.1 class I SAM-dependent methyltransferase [Candidatus Nitrospira allomarina]